MRRSVVAMVALAVLSVGIVAGCSTQASQLQGTDWLLKIYPAADGSQAMADPAVRTTALFQAGVLSGSGGCNQYSTAYQLSGDKLTIGPAASTMMACPDPAGAQEQAYFAALPNTASYAVSRGTLTLYNGSGTAFLVFEESHPLPLSGPRWTATAVNNGQGGVVSVVAGTELTAYFGSDNQVGGSAGCNTYFGPYKALRGDSIRIGPLNSTMMACESADVSAQEAAYLVALQNSTSYTINATTLELRDGSGALQVSFTIALPATPAPTAAPTAEPTPTPAPDSDTHPQADAYTDAQAHADADAQAHAGADADTDTCSDPCPDTQAHAGPVAPADHPDASAGSPGDEPLFAARRRKLQPGGRYLLPDEVHPGHDVHHQTPAGLPRRTSTTCSPSRSRARWTGRLPSSRSARAPSSRS